MRTLHPTSVTRLRLVGSDEPVTAFRPDDAPRGLRRAVAEENVAAAHRSDLDPTDPRWRLAAEAAGLLDGAALPPDRRERVLATARRLGVRLFDANLIIAVVQDAARRGEPLETRRSTLSIVGAGEPAPSRSSVPLALTIVAAVLAATGVNLVLIAWLLG